MYHKRNYIPQLALPVVLILFWIFKQRFGTSLLGKTLNSISRNVHRSHTVFPTAHAALDAAPMADLERRVQPQTRNEYR